MRAASPERDAVTPAAAPPAAAAECGDLTWAGSLAAGPAPRGVVVSSRTAKHPRLAPPVDVLADLQRDAERVLERLVGAEREQRPRPGDRLPHPGQLVELLPAQPGDRL